jgi:hypothetical protein
VGAGYYNEFAGLNSGSRESWCNVERQLNSIERGHAGKVNNQTFSRRRKDWPHAPKAAVQNPSRSAKTAPRVSPTQPFGQRARLVPRRAGRGNGTDGRLTICISVLGRRSCGTILADSVSDDTPEGHVDDPDDERDEGCEGGAEGHEDGADARVAGAAEAEDCSEEGKYSGHGMEDHRGGEAADGECVETVIAGGDVSGRGEAGGGGTDLKPSAVESM